MKNLKGQVIVGPTLRQVQTLGLDGASVDIATAFYTRRALDSLTITAKHARLLFRVDLANTRDWVRGYVAPDALLAKIDALLAKNIRIDLFGHPKAHVKAYVGSRGALVGSANLTLRGLGGGLELAVRARDTNGVKLVRDALTNYQKRLDKIELDDLRDFVTTNLKTVKAEQKKWRQEHQEDDEDRLPNVARDQIAGAMGSYPSFLAWLGKRKTAAAKETFDRANGKSHLQGHIHRNYYGLRQFFLAFPELQVLFSKGDEDTYKLSKDAAMEALLKEFVLQHAADEEDFSLDRWKTYLPIECGGRAERHGGTIGNLNRMLPLVAKYLEHLQKQV
jgi:hypothetical protein